LLALAALAVDMPVARAVRDGYELPPMSSFFRLFDKFEVFGHGLGVVALVLAIHQLDPRRRWAIPRLLACAFGSGLVANLLKLIVLRTRPFRADLDGSVWSTFETWFPLLGVGNAGQSFPSAHTATVIGLAAALVWLYPQGRWLFAMMVALVGCQRITSGMHFPSDVLMGAAVGCLVAPWFLTIGPAAAWFDRLERRWKPSGQ